MSESWRSILERAAENLSIDLDQMAAPAFSHAQAAMPRPRRLSPQLSFAESRARLAQELQAFSPQPQKAPQAPLAAPLVAAGTALTVPVTAPEQMAQPARAQSRKRTPWLNIFATILSAVITGGMTTYLLLAHGGVGKENLLALATYVNQGFSAAGMANSHAAPAASMSAAAVANRSTEDALMERAAYQLKRGDGESGRAVFEALASHGSLRAAFALAESYDPAKLSQHGGWGLRSDIRLARKWYKKASELGSVAAYERLRDLEKRASLQQKAAKL
jgi:TPR repeat protein